MSESLEIAPIASFYFFSLLDEARAKQASRITYRECLASIETTQAPVQVHIVAQTFKYWSKLKKNSGKESAPLSLREGFALTDLDLGPWKQFQKEGEEDELLAVIWSHILGFSDENIALGLNSTAGTIRHRISRGLKKLGQFQYVGRLSES